MKSGIVTMIIVILALLALFIWSVRGQAQRLEDSPTCGPDQRRLLQSVREDQKDRELRQYQQDQIRLQQEQNQILRQQHGLYGGPQPVIVYPYGR